MNRDRRWKLLHCRVLNDLEITGRTEEINYSRCFQELSDQECPVPKAQSVYDPHSQKQCLMSPTLVHLTDKAKVTPKDLVQRGLGNKRKHIDKPIHRISPLSAVKYCLNTFTQKYVEWTNLVV